jgi:hypothetical protein
VVLFESPSASFALGGEPRALVFCVSGSFSSLRRVSICGCRFKGALVHHLHLLLKGFAAFSLGSKLCLELFGVWWF